jgi:hypothetical protein
MIGSRVLRRLLLLAVMFGLPVGSRSAATEQRTEVAEVARAAVMTEAAPLSSPAVSRAKRAAPWPAGAVVSSVAATAVVFGSRLYIRHRRLLL